ncbi:hypothetical protein RIF29_26461 [Crotalaria pallida]|uniref:Uncharacterized protein n=1 Tax=Crotalaria pallida TaxID=3830 RepID=A0AAN9EMR7_CROPI
MTRKRKMGTAMPAVEQGNDKRQYMIRSTRNNLTQQGEGSSSQAPPPPPIHSVEELHDEPTQHAPLDQQAEHLQDEHEESNPDLQDLTLLKSYPQHNAKLVWQGQLTLAPLTEEVPERPAQEELPEQPTQEEVPDRPAQEELPEQPAQEQQAERGGVLGVYVRKGRSATANQRDQPTQQQQTQQGGVQGVYVRRGRSATAT